MDLTAPSRHLWLAEISGAARWPVVSGCGQRAGGPQARAPELHSFKTNAGLPLNLIIALMAARVSADCLYVPMPQQTAEQGHAGAWSRKESGALHAHAHSRGRVHEQGDGGACVSACERRSMPTRLEHIAYEYL